VTGTMNTLVVKMMAGPGPTTLPIKDAPTIHHRFCKDPLLSPIAMLDIAFLPHHRSVAHSLLDADINDLLKG
jgi:hypothetical protein